MISIILSEAVKIVDCLVASKGYPPLSEVERLILKGAWEDKTYENIAEEGDYSPDYLSKDVAPKLWKRLSKAFDEPVKKKNLCTVIERNQDIQQALKRLQLREKNSPEFIGRESALNKLNDFTDEGKKIILIHQRGGEGKTTLARQFLKRRFGDEVIEFLIPKEPKAVSSVEILLEEPLRKLETEPGLELSASLNRLKQKLKIKEVGVLIDNIETLLDGNGKFLESHRSYLELLRILDDTNVRSTTIITSRSQLCESSFNIKIYHLEALDITVWQRYFYNQGLSIEEDSLALREMYKTHGGNALAMKIHCGRAVTDFRSHIDAYWKNVEGNRLLKGEIRNDDSQLRNLVIEQFDYLRSIDKDAYKLLIRMGCYRYQDDVPKVTKRGLVCLLWDISDDEYGRIITSLRERALIEFNFDKETEVGEYWLHPEIKAEAVSRLRKVEDWKVTHQRAAQFWHQEVEQIEDSENALKALESYYHYMMIDAYEEAAKELLFRRTNSVESANRFENGATLGGSLIKHSLFSQIEFAAKNLIIKVTNEQYLSKLHSFLGCIYRDRGEIYRAIEHFEKSQRLAVQAKEKFNHVKQYSQLDEIVFKELMADSLLNIANCKAKLGEFDQALSICKCVENMLEYEEEEYFLKRKIHTYFSLAYILSFEAYDKNEVLKYAHKAYEENLPASLDKHILGLRLVLLGSAYKNIGEFKLAIKFYSLAINYEKCPTVVKAEALYGLAEIYRNEQSFEHSKQFCKDAIKYLEGIGARFGLAEAYLQLGLTLKAQSSFEESRKSVEQAIKICQDMGAIKQIARIEKITLGHVSCGALVFRTRQKAIEVLLLYRELTDSWHLPKGTYEPEQDTNYTETAVREVYEETGFEVELLTDLGSLPSEYYLYGEKINKVTYYFLGKPVRQHQTGVPDQEHDKQRWLKKDEAKARLSSKSIYENEAQIIERFEAIQKAKSCHFDLG